jgi:hypothetical protein
MDWNVNLFLLTPIYQALLFLLLTTVLILLIRPRNADRAWLIAAYTFGLFLIVNAVLLWFDNSPWRYFFYSMGSAIGYVLFIAIVMRVLLSVLKLKDTGESAMAFLILIYQPFALLLVMLTKWIVNKWF